MARIRINRSPEQPGLFDAPLLNRPLNVNPGLRAPDPVEPPRLVRTRIAPGTKQDSSGSSGTGAGNHPATAPNTAPGSRDSDQPDETKPFSHFTKTNQLSADEARRAIRGQSLGYTGVWFIRTGVAVCRDCHEGMTAGTQQFIPKGFEGQGPMATVYDCQQRKPNVDARCGVCGQPTIGEVMGPNGV